MSRKPRSSGDNQFKSTIKPFVPKNEEQRECAEIIRENDIIFCLGKIGAGKTHVAAAIAAEELCSGKYKRIILGRPAVSMEDTGFLPGSADDKILPYLKPLINELGNYLNVDNEIKAGRVILEPIGYVRGLTWKDSVVLIDEFFNLKPSQLKTVATRLGSGSKLIFTGCASQTDLGEGNAIKINTMLDDLEDCLNENDRIAFYELTESVRHPLIDKILGAWGE